MTSDAEASEKYNIYNNTGESQTVNKKNRIEARKTIQQLIKNRMQSKSTLDKKAVGVMSSNKVPKNNSVSRLLAFDSNFTAKRLNEEHHRKTAINLLAHHQVAGDANIRLPVLQVDKDAIPRCQSFHYIPFKK